MSALRRYPGVKPFETAERDLFFGRERDIQDLHDLVLLEKMVVLFGKSGYGKSSLINAGLIPLLTDAELDPEDRMRPLTIRMRSYTPQENSPVDKVKEMLTEQLQVVDEAAAFDELWEAREGQPSLWAGFRRRVNADTPQLLLVFDQFEEFFTYPAAQQARFRQELAELLYTEIPQTLRNDWRSIDRAQRRFLSRPMKIKVLFAIRQDKLSLMNGLRDQLPTILQKRYELQGLTLSQAREAIVEPAKLSEGDYQSHAFEYEPKALDILIRELSQGQRSDPYAAGQAVRIESFLLQICCEYIESRAIETEDKLIEPEDLPDFANIYEAYYNGKIGELPEMEQPAARKLMEEGLLYYDRQTGEARRLSVDKDQLILDFRTAGVDEELLNDLKNKFLIREERNSVGGFSYEISHDTLLAPILKAREIRQKEEERKAIRKRNLRFAAIIGVAGLVTTGAIFFGIWAFAQKAEADLQRDKAQKAQAEAQVALDSLQTMNRTRFEENLTQGQEFLSGNLYNQAVVAFQVALEFDSTNTAAKAGIAEAQAKSGVAGAFNKLMAQGDRQMRAGRYLAALRSFRQALATGYNNAEAKAQIKIARANLETRFNELVKSADTFAGAGYTEAAREKYLAALQIKNDPDVRSKLNDLPK